MSGGRSYSGPALDGTVQYITEAPAYQDPDGETVYATDPVPQGTETTVDEPSSEGPDDVEDDDPEQDSSTRTRDRVRGSGTGPRTRRRSGPSSQATLADFDGGDGR